MQQALERLIGNTDTTPEEIFRASDNVAAIRNAAAVVGADFSQATDAVETAIGEAQALIERYKAKSGEVLLGEAAMEALETMERAWGALSAARDAWLCYRPWRIALETLDKAMQQRRIVEST